MRRFTPLLTALVAVAALAAPSNPRPAPEVAALVATGPLPELTVSAFPSVPVAAFAYANVELQAPAVLNMPSSPQDSIRWRSPTLLSVTTSREDTSAARRARPPTLRDSLLTNALHSTHELTPRPARIRLRT